MTAIDEMYLRVASSAPLWECQKCGAVVQNMPRHVGWHVLGDAPRPVPNDDSGADR